MICLILGGIETKNMTKSFLKNYKSKTISNRMANIGEYNEFISFFDCDFGHDINNPPDV